MISDSPTSSAQACQCPCRVSARPTVISLPMGRPECALATPLTAAAPSQTRWAMALRWQVKGQHRLSTRLTLQRHFCMCLLADSSLQGTGCHSCTHVSNCTGLWAASNTCRWDACHPLPCGTLPALGPPERLAVLSTYSPCYPAGIIGGNTYGVAKNVTLYSVKVFSSSPSTNLTQILQAVQWVQNNAIKPAGAVADCTWNAPDVCAQHSCQHQVAGLLPCQPNKCLLVDTQDGNVPCPEQSTPASTAWMAGSGVAHGRCCLSARSSQQHCQTCRWGHQQSP